MSEKPVFNIKFRFYEIIPESRLENIWYTNFPDKPFPKVKAYLLKNREYHKLIEIVKKIQGVQTWEWGSDEVKNSTAFIFKPNDKCEYIIIVKRGSPYSLDEDLKHELNHIYSGHL